MPAGRESPVRRFLRDLASYLAVLLVVAAVGGFAWLTHNPDSPVLAAAEEWPVVGGLAQRMRRAYLGEPPAAPAEEGVGPAEPEEAERADQLAAAAPLTLPPPPGAPPPEPFPTDEPLHLPAPDPDHLPELVKPIEAPDLGRIIRRGAEVPVRARHLAIEWRWFLPGQPVREARGDGTGGRALPSLAYLPVVAREAGWSQVIYQGRPGWVDDGWAPAHPRRGARQGGMRARYEPPRGSHWTRLRQARKILGQKRPERTLGAYKLWTDVEDEELLAFLDTVAVVAEEAYFARLGRLPSGDPLRSAVLFAREEDYRRYSGESELPQGHSGHAGNGVLASYTAGRPRGHVASTLVHEITHLLNARALAWDLPPWLEEGLASEMGAVWVEDTGVDSVDGRASAVAATFRGFDDHDTSLFLLGERLASGTLPALPAVLLLDREGFYRDSATHYAYAGVLVRYLLDGDGGRHRASFLRFLKRIADGYQANGALFVDSFGTRDPAILGQLDHDFRRWLAAEVPAARRRLEGTARRLAGR